MNLTQNYDRQFRHFCGNGNLDKAILLLQAVPTINISADNEAAFRWACEYGHLEVAKWLLTIKPTIDISADNKAVCISAEFGYSAFISACGSGHLEVAKWLLTISPTIDISAENEYAFKCACTNGHLKVATWLLQIKPTITISAENDYAFRGACRYGHLEIAKLFQEMCPEKYQITQKAPAIRYNILTPLNKSTEILYLNVLDNCPICDDSVGVVHVSTPCRHRFCEPCLHQWLKTHNSCPGCRGNLKNTAFQPVLEK